jgi:bifunctional UDP-N-acetylglucosamine pyrophosphorylase/glucosamine-1-phosphate N-acetyltransferase
MTVNVVIMAAGKGTRMKSERPKVLHRLAGRSLLQHVLDMTAALGVQRRIVVAGHGAEQVEAAAAGAGVHFVRQVPQLGTGHAVQQAVPALDMSAPTTLVLNGDVPLVTVGTARALAEACGGERLALLTVELDDPTGYGRIVRGGDSGTGTGVSQGNGNNGNGDDQGGSEGGTPVAGVRAIVEHKDASAKVRAIREVYTGMMAAPTAMLVRWVAALRNDNVQGEYYLTDLVALAVAEGVPVVTAQPASATEVLGVNSPAQLANLERRLQRARAEALMADGVRLADPARLDVRGDLHCAGDVEIDVGCVFEGTVRLGEGVSVGAHCVIRDAVIDAGAVIHPFTHIDGAQVGAGSLIGPYARLRPGAQLAEDVHIGNFVEVKNATLARGAKANHLAYLGDATVGQRVNFGAGSITANYDGAYKHRTVIGDDVHVGSNCVLVAPLTIGAGATIGGGSTLGKDAPAGQLTLARARQVSLAGWVRPVKGQKPQEPQQ